MKPEKIVLLAKTKFHTIEVLISIALMDPYISHNKLMSVNVLQEYYLNEEIKNVNNR